MKDFRGMKRQRSRNRKPSGNQNNPNRAYESNGPEGTKVRGNAQTIYEKYQQLARDANSSGDRVLAENHLQHAEHYFRMIRQMQPQRPVSEFVQRDPFASGFDLDYDDESEAEGPEAETEAVADEAQGDDSQRFDNRNNGNRDRNRHNDRQNNDRQNGDRQNGGNRNFEPRGFEPRNGSGDVADLEGGRRETRRERYERRRALRLSEQEQNMNGAAPASPGYIASTEPLGAPRAAGPSELVPPPAAEQPAVQAPVRERRERAPRPADTDHLPAFLRAPSPAVAEAPVAEGEEKPRRGRRRKAEDVGAAEEA